MPKFSALLPVLLTALSLGTAARAEDGFPDAAKIDAFNGRLFAASVAGKTSYACFVRRYDADHLAHHPKQKVNAMKLLVSSEYDTAERLTTYSFRLGVRYRHRSGDFDSSGSCSHLELQTAGGEVRMHCSVDCDGGGIEIALGKEDKSTVVRLERIRIWQNNKPDDEAEHALVAGADDRVFRLDRVETRECESLVTDRKELAAIRRK